MATGDTKAYRNFLDKMIDGTAVVDFNSDTIKLMLLKSTYTPNYTTADYAASLTTYQVTTGAAYADGGPSLTSLSVTVSGSFAIFKAGTISVAMDASTGFATARYGLIYKATGNFATSPVVALVDLGSDRVNTSGPLQIYWTGDKILKFQQ